MTIGSFITCTSRRYSLHRPSTSSRSNAPPQADEAFADAVGEYRVVWPLLLPVTEDQLLELNIRSALVGEPGKVRVRLQPDLDGRISRPSPRRRNSRRCASWRLPARSLREPIRKSPAHRAGPFVLLVVRPSPDVGVSLAMPRACRRAACAPRGRAGVDALGARIDRSVDGNHLHR